MKTAILIIGMALALTACKQQAPTGKACLGEDGDTLIESLGKDTCQQGDIIGTKHPAYFCDFNYAVTFNDYNSAFCVYVGKIRENRQEF